MADLAILEEVLRMVLEIINSCVTNTLHHNPNLVYTLLHRRELFAQFRTHPTFQDIIQNIDTLIIPVMCLLGVEHLSTYLKCYKVGDIVDVKVRFEFYKVARVNLIVFKTIEYFLLKNLSSSDTCCFDYFPI
ncbi:predicted protein [Nematostella vectensis]|uniref:Dymeclin n=1 Tax=Nematostella vectensis TaxID=45351 RepID=A7TAZ0_NEMVE|nr:predicted protein [Nematostella vectensis]|eukprot:XP_001618927.1 hypothetical protein NEMVEDRAFT_v1g224684 [Nematostella vectensis]